MPAILISILTMFASSLVARMLLGAGLAIFTYNQIMTLQDNLKNALLSSMSGFPADIINIMGLLRIDFYISVILSAMGTAAFLKAAKIFIGKAG